MAGPGVGDFEGWADEAPGVADLSACARLFFGRDTAGLLALDTLSVLVLGFVTGSLVFSFFFLPLSTGATTSFCFPFSIFAGATGPGLGLPLAVSPGLAATKDIGDPDLLGGTPALLALTPRILRPAFDEGDNVDMRVPYGLHLGVGVLDGALALAGDFSFAGLMTMPAKSVSMDCMGTSRLC